MRDRFKKIVNVYGVIRFSGYQQNVVESCFFQGFDFQGDFAFGKRFSFDFVVQAETAIGTNVLTFVAQIQRRVHLDGFAKTFFGRFVTDLGHLFQIRLGSGRNQGQKIIQIAFVFGQCEFDFLRGSLVYFGLDAFPIVLFKNRFECCHF